MKYVYDRSTIRAARTKNEIGIHALRGGNIHGEHEVVFAGFDEVLEVRHSITSRQVFAIGALKAAGYTAAKPAGLYNMQDLIEEC
jgi:4-hydroxy-tetrahydrodipicolinate reductase